MGVLIQVDMSLDHICIIFFIMITFRQIWLNHIRQHYGFELQPIVDTSQHKEAAYDLLAKRVAESLDMERVQKIIDKEDIRL